MSLQGRPKGEYRSAQHEGSPVNDPRYAVTSLPAAAVLFPAALPVRGRQANEESFQ
jgi:hypothetical protein